MNEQLPVLERFFGPSLQRQYERVVYLPEDERFYVEVPGLIVPDGTNSSEGFGVSTKPIWVASIKDCCSTVLLGQTHVGASHYNLDTGAPEEYLPRMIDEFLANGEPNATAVVVGGDRGHYGRILSMLREYHIPVVGKMRDGRIMGHWRQKNLVAVPGTRRVIVQITDGLDTSYRRLS